MLHPDQFRVNEAWIAFHMSETPIHTLRDGDFLCIALMDAASCYIHGSVMAPVGTPEPSAAHVRGLFKKGWTANRRYPTALYLPDGRFPRVFPTEGRRQGITVVVVQESELLTFIGEARQGFNEYMQGGSSIR